MNQFYFRLFIATQSQRARFEFQIQNRGIRIHLCVFLPIVYLLSFILLLPARVRMFVYAYGVHFLHNVSKFDLIKRTRSNQSWNFCRDIFTYFSKPFNAICLIVLEKTFIEIPSRQTDL